MSAYMICPAPHAKAASRAAADCRQRLEQDILAQIEVLHPIALRLTGNRRSADALTECTVRTALQKGWALLKDGRPIKAVMLSMLRDHFKAQYCAM